MSGCVNCVWDRYRDEMEEWALANAEAQSRLAAGSSSEEGASAAVASEREGANVGVRPSLAETTAGHTVVSMDDDGGGSETNWDVGAKAPVGPGRIAKDFWNDDLYKNVPVGIREFMKQEKKLKEKHLREGTTGG
ncbi:hypothetical protein M406DRAFT_358105 [Cryphonectria parasitica EP155]|uniref:Oxidoreductase-like domain-containing protein n=1 Tax=Cryphonectria parasitica (strain ATCC 38755 / EP155) TaxID=660469 RepID=A0A9P5CK21_CRYP1|nr:uncharacterized protein M406DRAFT_358105 [Cryphonectria parasitica EP155]KAF3761824.1 hypothetical protein M406DRAFT_358105 [Cryphonectria parasitica EP155]